MKAPSITRAAELLFVAALAFLAYAPSLNIPLIADDYPNISQARTWGAPAGLHTILGDAQFRLRSTSYWIMYALWSAAGLAPAVYHAASLLLHVINAWLVLSLTRAWPATRPAALFAAAFFAVHEGHQEAVMWFSAISELLMFGFGIAALLCWTRQQRIVSAALFALALLSKESAVILLPLFVLTTPPRRWTRLWPHATLCALALASIAASRTNSFRFSDGSFSLSAPFWIALPLSFARLLWIFGWPALAILVFTSRDTRRTAAAALAWMAIAFVPYSFLTYSTSIPSRQTYLASAGLALLIGLAAAHCHNRWPHRRRVLAAAFALVLALNAIYLWIKKRPQFLARAAPTTELIALARRTSAPIFVQCFPLPAMDAEEAVRLAAGRTPESLLWTPAAAQSRPDAVPFCYREPR